MSTIPESSTLVNNSAPPSLARLIPPGTRIVLEIPYNGGYACETMEVSLFAAAIAEAVRAAPGKQPDGTLTCLRCGQPKTTTKSGRRHCLPCHSFAVSQGRLAGLARKEAHHG